MPRLGTGVFGLNCHSSLQNYIRESDLDVICTALANHSYFTREIKPVVMVILSLGS